MGWVRSTYGERRDACSVLVGKPQGKRPLEDQGVDGGIIDGSSESGAERRRLD